MTQPDSSPPLVKTLDNQPLEFSRPGTGDNPSRPSSRRSPMPVVALVAVVLLLLSVPAYLFVFIPARRTLHSLRQLESSSQALLPSIKSQDLPAILENLSQVKNSLDQFQSTYAGFTWVKFVPLARNYYLDGQAAIAAAQDLLSAAQIAVDTVAPYADVIGLKGLATSADGGKTAEDRINFIINTLDKLQPQLTAIAQKLSSAKSSLGHIDPLRYPQEFRSIAIRPRLTEGINLVNQATSLATEAQPLLKSAPQILGIDSPRRYLILFQNDAEIRATGGFLTGYAVINVDKGKISTVESDDIYKLDEKFPKKIPAPAPILKYHPLVPYWYLRDQNLSPDFKVSMDTFAPNYQLTRSPSINGIIAVDTQLLVDLLKVTGPIGVPGLGTFTANEDPRCNCPQVFYELQLIAGGEEPVVWDSVSGKIVQAPANYGHRKAFLGPLMYSVLANVMAQPKGQVPLLVDTFLKALQGKHLLAYFHDSDIQTAAEAFNIAGRLKNTTGDYLMVVDTNFSGAKTNIWVTYKADQKIDISSDGTVTKTLTLTYSNPQSKAVKITQARNLNGLFRNWLRVYVPKGSQLQDVSGFETGKAVAEDLDKTVFEGFFTLAPGNTRQIVFRYQLPFKVKSPYHLLLQKQGGSKIFPYTLSLNNKTQPEVLLSQDQDLTMAY